MAQNFVKLSFSGLPRGGRTIWAKWVKENPGLCVIRPYFCLENEEDEDMGENVDDHGDSGWTTRTSPDAKRGEMCLNEELGTQMTPFTLNFLAHFANQTSHLSAP